MSIDKPLPVTAAQAQPISKMSEEELAKSIKEKISMMIGSFRNSVTHAMEIGDLLNEAKSRVGHGNFEAWLSTHCQLSFRTARRYMQMAKNRAQIEAQLTVKSATLADLNAQRLLTDQSGGRSNNPTESATKDKKKPTQTPAGEYDQLEEKLIDKLKELDPSEARDHADKTIAALNDTVADIASIAKRAATKASKLGAVAPPSQA
jgi:hypothetical protein